MKNKKSGACGFICGMPRSGTTWLAKCIGSSEHASVFGETQYWGKKYVKNEDKVYCKKDISNILKNIWGFVHADGKKIRVKKILKEHEEEITRRAKTPKELFDDICEKISNHQSTEKVFEKTPHHVNYVDRIAEEYVNAKFLITKRNPYDFALSYKHQKDRREGLEKIQFEKMYHPLGVSMVYRGYCKSIKKAVSKYPKRTMVVSLEEIKESPKKVVNEAYEFFEIGGERVVLPPINSSFPESKTRTLNTEDIFFINILSNKMSEDIGYEESRPTNFDMSVLGSIVKSPQWAWNVFVNMSIRSERPLRYMWSWAKKIFR